MFGRDITVERHVSASATVCLRGEKTGATIDPWDVPQLTSLAADRPVAAASMEPAGRVVRYASTGSHRRGACVYFECLLFSFAAKDWPLHKLPR